ncbi:MAG: HD domain-containing protein [Lachnospiraceae bacterium]|nr:HD domain-containing protein [Lachnospiraceae bacterium]
MSIKTFAAVDVGSFESSMKIFEFDRKNHMREIDYIGRKLDLGSDTYANRRISQDKMDELCRTLKEFMDIMKSYKVEAYQAYGTSAIREMENCTIILDQIAQRTGMQLSVLSNSEQRFLDYKSVASKGEAFRRIIEEKTAVLDIGGGSIQLSQFDNDTLVSTQNLKLGVLRIQEYLNHASAKSSQYESLIEEMAMAQLATYKKLYLKDKEIKNIIVVDDYIAPWVVKLAKTNAKQGDIKITDDMCMTPESMETFLQLLRGHQLDKLAYQMDIAEEMLPLAFISAVLIQRIAGMTGAERIYFPGVTLSDGIAYEYAEKHKLLKDVHDFEQDIVACAMNISKRYMGSRKRAETLDHITTTIFDSMMKLHGLGKRERLYLRIAAILHDCGKFISLTNIGENSYNIIMATEMIGLSHAERELVANVVRFNHSKFVYMGQSGVDTPSGGMDKQSYLTIAKLTAILRLANSLDRSHKQKLKTIKAQLKENQLILSADTMEDVTLEKRYFQAGVAFFREVFSVEPIFRQKKNF